MVTSWSTTKEEESHRCKRREVVDSSEQRVSGKGIAADANMASTIGQLPSHLQPMVTLLAKMTFPSKEGKLREKRGKNALE